MATISLYLHTETSCYLVTIDNGEIVDVVPQKLGAEVVLELKNTMDMTPPQFCKDKPTNNFPGRKSLKSLQRLGR